MVEGVHIVFGKLDVGYGAPFNKIMMHSYSVVYRVLYLSVVMCRVP